MYAEYSICSNMTKDQVSLMHKNIQYKLERERAVLISIIKQYLKKGVKNLGEIDSIINQNNKVDEIIIQEMYYRELLNYFNLKEA